MKVYRRTKVGRRPGVYLQYEGEPKPSDGGGRRDSTGWSLFTLNY